MQYPNDADNPVPLGAVIPSGACPKGLLLRPPTSPPATATRARRNLSWPPILAQAAAVVAGYDTGVGPGRRQLFYRLVAAELLPNIDNAYKGLSRETAEARRAGWFPPLIDRTRTVHEAPTFTDPADALDVLAKQYRLDRTDGQAVSLYLGVEKHGLVEQLVAWFGDRGVPVLALGGYAGQSYVDMVRQHVAATGRSAVLLYAGDFDPSGEDIDRDFVSRCDCFDDVIRVALTSDQVAEHHLPPQPGKSTDSRSGAFTERHGRLVQVEVDALPPDTLRGLFTDAIMPFWDTRPLSTRLSRGSRSRRLNSKRLLSGGRHES